MNPTTVAGLRLLSKQLIEIMGRAKRHIVHKVTSMTYSTPILTNRRREYAGLAKGYRVHSGNGEDGEH